MAARKTAADYDPELLKLFDGYVHNQMSRADFCKAAEKFATKETPATELIQSLMPNYAIRLVDPEDPEIQCVKMHYKSPEGHGSIEALLVRPSGDQKRLPGVIVVHENRGRTLYIEDVARRVAKAGFLAFAPDGLSPVGGYPGNDDDGRAMQKDMDKEKLKNDFFAAFEYLKARDDVTKIGVVGFCYGGGISNAMATKFPDLACAVPFYGRQAPLDDVPAIKAPLLIHYGGLDERINAGHPDYEAKLNEHGVAFTAHFYDGAQHGFHNDTTPRFDEQAASLAWQRTIAFFDLHLRD